MSDPWTALSTEPGVEEMLSEQQLVSLSVEIREEGPALQAATWSPSPGSEPSTERAVRRGAEPSSTDPSRCFCSNL